MQVACLLLVGTDLQQAPVSLDDAVARVDAVAREAGWPAAWWPCGRPEPWIKF